MTPAARQRCKPESTIQRAVHAAYERGFWDGIEAMSSAMIVLPEGWKDQAEAAAYGVYRTAAFAPPKAER